MAKTLKSVNAYPHPVLSVWTDDHKSECGYAITTEQNAYVDKKGFLVARILHRIDCSVLSKAVLDGTAVCAVRATSLRTLKRETITVKPDNDPFAHKIQLASENYRGDDQTGITVTLAPFVIATSNEPWEINEHYHPEYSNAGLNNFKPGKGGLLAAGDGIKITADDVSPESIVDISITEIFKEDPHRFAIDLDSDRIIIKVTRTTHEQIQRAQIGRFEPVLHSALYLHAITEALRNLGKYPKTRWTESLTDALAKHKCPTDEDEIRSNPLHYAQILLDHPLKDTVTLLGEPLYDEEEAF